MGQGETGLRAGNTKESNLVTGTCRRLVPLLCENECSAVSFDTGFIRSQAKPSHFATDNFNPRMLTGCPRRVPGAKLAPRLQFMYGFQGLAWARRAQRASDVPRDPTSTVKVGAHPSVFACIHRNFAKYDGPQQRACDKYCSVTWKEGKRNETKKKALSTCERAFPAAAGVTWGVGHNADLYTFQGGL